MRRLEAVAEDMRLESVDLGRDFDSVDQHQSQFARFVARSREPVDGIVVRERENRDSGRLRGANEFADGQTAVRAVTMQVKIAKHEAARGES